MTSLTPCQVNFNWRMHVMPNTDETKISGLLDTFAEGWNAGSGASLARVFAEDADFTNVMGLRARGRDVIARGHDEILATLFRGTRLTAVVERIRLLRRDVAVVDATLGLRAAEGGLFAGPAESRATFVATRESDEWSIASFTNMIPFARLPAGPLERSLARG
jgi:uncharacterized protein (TIGR02246 family)